MSRPSPALILPISDLVLSRDDGRKLRLAGIVTAISPTCSSLVTLTDPFPAPHNTPTSVLVDLSLCTAQPAAAWTKTHPQTVPPELKTKLMVIGHLVRRETRLDISWATAQHTPLHLAEPQIPSAIARLSAENNHLVPNPFFVLEAILIKPLDHTFDLALWNHTARLRSHHEWTLHHHESQSQSKGKRKATD